MNLALYLLIALIIWPIATFIIAKLVTGSNMLPSNDDWGFATLTGFVYSVCWLIAVPLAIIVWIIIWIYNHGGWIGRKTVKAFDWIYLRIFLRE